MAGATRIMSGGAHRFDKIGSAAVEPFSVPGICRVLETVGWGDQLADKIRIAIYYALRVSTGALRRDHDLLGGMYPKYWIGDVTVRSPIGRFVCRARTIDFYIINPHYEAIEVQCFHDRLARSKGTAVVCLDVGAHIGKFSVYAGRLLQNRGRVLAFEPEPSSFATLEKNLRLNWLDNVTALNIACGNTDGMGLLSRSATANIGAHTLREVPGAERIPVMVRTLDRLLPELGIDKVDVIKLDVEYKEADVLRGARRTLEANPEVTVFFEETQEPRIADSIALLQSLDFRVDHLAGNIWMADRSAGGREFEIQGKRRNATGT